jgi:hypothetical protein
VAATTSFGFPQAVTSTRATEAFAPVFVVRLVFRLGGQDWVLACGARVTASDADAHFRRIVAWKRTVRERAADKSRECLQHEIVAITRRSTSAADVSLITPTVHGGLVDADDPVVPVHQASAEVATRIGGGRLANDGWRLSSASARIASRGHDTDKNVIQRFADWSAVRPWSSGLLLGRKRSSPRWVKNLGGRGRLAGKFREDSPAMDHGRYDAASVTMLLDAGALTFARGRETRHNARRLRDAAWHLRHLARRVRGLRRDLILRHGLAPVISGASDVKPPYAFSMWIAPGHGASCDTCGKRIGDGETEFLIIGGGRELRLHRACYVLRMDELRATR